MTRLQTRHPTHGRAFPHGLRLAVLLLASVSATSALAESSTELSPASPLSPIASLATEQPDILVLMAEDLSPRIGAFGDALARKPNIDALASSGVRFPNTFTAAGVCAPSRAAFITGRHQISFGAQHMRTSSSPVATYLTVPPVELKAFPEYLRAAGYYTFTDRKLDYQFSGVWAGSGPESIWDSEGAADPFADLPDDQPFFGLINFLITHESAAFLPEDVPAGPGRGAAERARTARAALSERTAPEEVVLPPYYPDEPAVRAHIADHYDNVQLMDQQVGQILARLDALGRLDRTLILWTTDHGDPLPRAKRELYDSGLKVPLLIRWPEGRLPEGFEAGASDERLVSFVDLAPTLLAFAGITPADAFHGRNLFAADAAPRRYVYASRDRIDAQDDRVRAVRDERYKYLRYYRPGTPGAVHLAYRDQGRIMRALWRHAEAGTLNPVQSLWFEPRPTEALYDLEADPHELVNLVDERAQLATLTRLRTALGAWRLRVQDLSEESEAELAERFWPGGEQPVTAPPTFKRLESGKVSISAEPGASIEYRFGGSPWRLYQEPVPAAGDLEARAVRYGYALSRVSSLSSSP
ncbi:MAG: sulfatase-like hydrolase/transferase [Pseudomonadota bacterium]